jgi:glutaconyl-CoA/methylmalonyl-CoA decarboxylase subunit gamma
MKYFVHLNNGRSFEVEVLESADPKFRLSIDGRPVSANFIDVDRMGQYAALLNDRSFAASIDQHGPQDLRVTIGGESFQVTATDEREYAAGQLASSRPRTAMVLAQMPGIVIQLQVQLGDIVQPGQPLLVLEAMKMQNQISAEHAGVVEEIMVAAGEAVAGNQPMIKLGPLEEPPA